MSKLDEIRSAYDEHEPEWLREERRLAPLIGTAHTDTDINGKYYCGECGALAVEGHNCGDHGDVNDEPVPLEKPRLIGTYGYELDTTTCANMILQLRAAWRALGASAEFTCKVKHLEYGDCAPDAIEVWVQ